MTPIRAIYVLWLVWIVSWLVAAFWSAPTEKRPNDAWARRLVRLVPLAGGVLLLGTFARHHLPVLPLWRVGPAAGWVLASLAAAGVALTWWARIHLGALWSGAIVRKTGHHIVQSGPYRLVRHPIYSGILFCACMTALAKGTAIALLGALVMTLGLFVKAVGEERFLRAELGATDYDGYARRVPMLVPFLRLR